MKLAKEAYLKAFYQGLAEKPLHPGDPKYVHLYSNPKLASSDPVAELKRTIDWSGLDSVQLFSGFRGTGKSTELLRLKRNLETEDNTKVILCNMREYLDLNSPVDVSDFLLSVAGAFGHELSENDSLLGKDLLQESYWTRFTHFLTETEVELTGLRLSADVQAASAQLQTNLKADPSFRRQLQKAMEGRIGALVDNVHSFFEDCVKALRKKHGDGTQIVLILDSVEQFRGTTLNFKDVAASVTGLFEGHADKLRFPHIHTVYTVPPWLKIKSPGIGGLYDGEQQIPCVKVQDRHGKPCAEGLHVLSEVITKRGDWNSLLGSREALNELITASGGYLRDLFRLIQAALRRGAGHPLPLSPEQRTLVLHEIRNSYLPLSNRDALWLDRVQSSQSSELEDEEQLSELSRYFDNHLVQTYRNGDQWWAVHPLLRDKVREQAERVRSRREQAALESDASQGPES